MSLDQFFNQIEQQLDAELPFVAYRKPKTALIKGMFQNDDVLHVISDFSESGFVFAPFDSKQDAFLIPLERSEMVTVNFADHDRDEVEIDSQEDTFDNTFQNHQIDKLAHIRRVERGVEAIKTGCFSKVVLSRREIIENVEPDSIKIFKRLLRQYATAFVSIWYHPKVGLWLGATPETLLSVRGSQMKTMALAGTQVFDGATEVVWKEKEKEEQQIVTDFIVESLQSIGDFQPALSVKASSDGSAVRSPQSSNKIIKILGPKTIKAGNLLHLQTEISMMLSPQIRNLKPILEALHPTPAVCGFPKEKAKAYIIENEGYPREFYSGFMGELHLKETTSRNTNRRNVENNAYSVQKSISDLYVNLRCMQIKNKTIYIYIGGGITKDSDADAEWIETVHKSKIIKSVL